MLLVVASLGVMLFSWSIYKKKRIRLLSFLLLFFSAATIGTLSLKTEWLNAIGLTFGLSRGADLIVYCAIIVLLYGVMSLYGKHSQSQQKQTEIIRAVSLQQGIGNIGDRTCVFVIPAYNESDHALEVLEEILDAGHGVVFVDDGSQNDLYQKVVKRFQGRSLLAIRHLVNLGQGAALQTGFSAMLQAPHLPRYAVTFDSDGQHLLSDLPHFLQAFKKNPNLDIVLGSRFLGSTINMPRSKKLVLKIGILFTSFFSGLRLTDTHNGYRMIKVASLPKIKITMNGMEHASEILDLINQKKLKYVEVPNTIVYTEYSMARGQKLSNSMRIVKNLVFKKILG